MPASASAVTKRMFGMRCPSPDWPRLAVHNAPLRRRARRSMHVSGKLTRHHLSTPYWLRENTRPGDYPLLTAVTGNGLNCEVFTIGVVGVTADLSGYAGLFNNVGFRLITIIRNRSYTNVFSC